MGKYLPKKGKVLENNECRHSLFSRTFPYLGKYFPILPTNWWNTLTLYVSHGRKLCWTKLNGLCLENDSIMRWDRPLTCTKNKYSKKLRVKSALRHSLFSRNFPFLDKYFPILTTSWWNTLYVSHGRKLCWTKQVEWTLFGKWLNHEVGSSFDMQEIQVQQKVPGRVSMLELCRLTRVKTLQPHWSNFLQRVTNFNPVDIANKLNNYDN